MTQQNDDRTKIFVSYSQKDKKYLQELQAHLSYHLRLGDIDFWDDARITPGSLWYQQMAQAIQAAKIIIILVSADYLASDFIAKNELPPILNTASQNNTTILPVILRSCFVEETSLARYQFVNSPSKPLSSMNSSAREKVWMTVAQFIEEKLPATVPFPHSPPSADQSTTSIQDESLLQLPSATPILKTTLYTYFGHSDRVNAVQWSPDGRYIASASDDLTVHVWDASMGSNICVFHGHSNFVLALSWSPDSRFIISSDADKTTHIWDIHLTKALYTIAYDKAIVALTWSPDGQYIAGATANFWPDKSEDDFIYLIDAFTSRVINTYQAESKPYAALAWSPDGQYLASAGVDGKMDIVRFNNFVFDRTFTTSADQINTIGWSPDGRFIASGGDDNIVHIWDFKTKKVINAYHGHSDPVRTLAWSPNGKYIASAGGNQTIQVWDVTTRNLIQTYYGHSDVVLTLAWSPDGQRVVSSGQDNTVQIWQINFQNTQEDAEYFLREGNIYLEGQRYFDALGAYEQAIKLDVSSAFAHFNKGKSLYNLTRYEEALLSINRAIELLPNEIDFYNIKSSVLCELKRYEEALKILKQALDISRKQGNQLIEQNELHLLGQINRDINRFQEAKDNFKAALSISSKLHDVQGEGRALLSLGLVAYQQGLLKNAKNFIEEARRTFEQLADLQNTLRTLIVLGQISNDLEQLGQAELYYKQAMTLANQSEDTDSQEYILLRLGELAAISQRLEEAGRYYRQALVIANQSEDLEKQRNLLQSLEKLADTTQNTDEAETLYKLALTIFEQLSGPEHFSTASILNNLAGLYQTQGRYAEGEPLYRRALAIREKQLGARHPDTALSLNNLAHFYQTQGKYAEAEPLYKRALAIYEQELGATYPDTVGILNNLALLYQAQGKYVKAESLYERERAIREQTLGAIGTKFDQKSQVVVGHQQNAGRDIQDIFPKTAGTPLKAKAMRTVKVLFLAANPANTNRLAIDEEMRAIEQKVRASEHRDVLSFQSAWAVRPDDLLQLLNQYRPQIVHFSGHGSQTGLSLAGNDGQARLVTTRALTALFATLKDNIRLVFLNACYSREQGLALTKSIDCVIGTKDSISDDAATIFASSFYRAIGFGRSIQEAFDQGTTALLLEGIPEEDIPELLIKDGMDLHQVVLTRHQANPS